VLLLLWMSVGLQQSNKLACRCIGLSAWWHLSHSLDMPSLCDPPYHVTVTWFRIGDTFPAQCRCFTSACGCCIRQTCFLQTTNTSIALSVAVLLCWNLPGLLTLVPTVLQYVAAQAEQMRQQLEQRIMQHPHSAPRQAARPLLNMLDLGNSLVGVWVRCRHACRLCTVIADPAMQAEFK
jgi:hypothetical protein